MKSGRAVIVVLAAAAAMGAAPRRAPVAPKRPAEITVPPAVAEAISALGVATPTRSLSRLDFTGTDTFRGVSQAYQRDLVLRPGGAPGVWRIEERSAPDADDDVGTSLSFMGLITITQDHWFKAAHGVVSATRVSEVTFSGDWADMRVGKTIGFTTHGQFTDNNQHTTHATDWQETCKVLAKLPAQRLLATLEGSAKKLKCTSTDGEIVYVTDEYLLEDYGFFVELKKYPNDFYYADGRLTKAE
jgi:hypothetical protein